MGLKYFCGQATQQWKRTARPEREDDPSGRRRMRWIATALVAAGIVACAPTATAAQAGSAAHVVIDYPIDGSVLPPDMTPPTFLWRDDAANVETWRIDISFADGSPEIHVTSKGEHMKIGEVDPRCISNTNKLPELTPEQAAAHTWLADAATWGEVRRHAVSGPATITVNGVVAGNVVSSGTMRLSISKDPVGAPIFYRDVPLMPSETEKGFIKPLASSAIPLINWRMRDVGQTSSHIVMNELHTCANCHSFSRDGSTMGLDMDGPQNDKGLYTLIPLAQKMTVRTQDMISWASFRGELDPQLRVGFMSQVSPNGRYVVTTVKPPGTKSSQFYYVANFKDYRFLQVFYPTRGILAWYDRQTKTLKPLPGADDPNFVQASATWSPDGKYLIFLRAGAKDPVPADGKMARYANDPAEIPMKYDMYRIPFNDGKGGKAEPIEGASQNGMSNSFGKVSPDGKWIVFVEAKNGLLMRPDSKLYIVPASGGTARLMKCNTPLMNSWHSFSPNGRWLVFSSKSRSPYTQMFLTHIDENGDSTPPVLIENSTAANRAVNIPEFVNMPPSGIEHIATPAVDFYKQYDIAADLAKKGDYSAAIPEWLKAVSMEPNDPRARNGYGQTLAHAGKPDEAIAQLKLAVLEKPNYVEAQNNLGIALDREGHETEAIAHYEKAIADNPGYAEAHNNLGRVLLKEKRVPEAIEQLQSALAINPEYAEAHNNLGYALATQGHVNEAEGEYRKAIEADPKYAHAYDNLGMAQAMKGRLEDAAASFAKAAELDPADGDAEGNLGHALLAENRVDDALPHFRKALELGPETAELRDNLGMALAQKGQTADAIPEFKRALEMAPNLSEARYYLGMALVMTGQRGQGLAEWRQLLRKEPDNVPVLNETAWVLATSTDGKVRNGAEAVTLAERAAELTSSREPEILGTLAAAYAEAGRFDKAVELEQRAAELASSQSKANLAATLNARLTQLEAKTPIRQN